MSSTWVTPSWARAASSMATASATLRSVDHCDNSAANRPSTGVDRGLYAVSFGGGQVEPATGDFVFGVSEGYLIENGRVTAPVRGATLVGNGLEALRAIDGIAGDLDIATGYCGKGGQTVPAGVGQPHVRIRELTVGGTAS